MDEQTGESLPFVNVFLANTTIGDAADDQGYYILEKIPPGIYDLIFSRIGYEVKVIRVKLSPSQNLYKDVQLKIQPIRGSEVRIEANEPMEWRKNLNLFKKIFIGETSNAKQCILLNPEYLSFSIDTASGDFLAFADVPLEIENKALGYKLSVVLNFFRWGAEEGLYAYYPHFIEMTPQDNLELQQWEKQREKAYLGSLRHFLFQLVNYGENKKFDYRLFRAEKIGGRIECFNKSPLHPLNMDIIYLGDFIFQKRFNYNGYLCIKDEKNRTTSFITFLNGFADIDSYGNILNARDYRVSGEWAKFRLADTLPLDYLIK